jgi:hypothetical protein
MLSLALAAALLASSGQWDSLKFLMGDWTAEGGSFSLRPELGGKILVRTNHSETKGAVHEDLMVIYPATSNATLRASYWDNEGHIINYTITADGKRAVFLSDGDAAGPRYRLSYENTGPGAIRIQFEVAPPAKDFQTYLQSSARRR